ncbi:dipeptidyl aminopeptidase/acylaminoacyl peptidase [Caulobacter ginsengisoli]|uniref:Dipeptidyl aminopeptidase/acylaminoacyl peptidase n=1 Tax=Caulobacter ginsengisoli TaxID=400775 RepID=A0ABU0ITX7_9CAUL|nr:prolyl oligopeptidase family serine peptidase [Caulobacter ginsengisoli]MDQ0465457.1 dipeptidyl aminopeptidase/acylaminoacyl peptidase [Caulobacter ginsengisoli]
MDRRRLLFTAAAGAFTLATAATAASADVVRRTQGSLSLENVPETPPAVREAIRRYQNARSANFQDWLPDGSMLITTRFGSTSQLHHVAGPGQERFQLTFFDEPIAGAAAQPGSDNRYLFTRDVGGGEYFQGFMAGLTGPETVVTEPNTRNQSFIFSRDGALLLWSRVTPGSGDYDIMAMAPGQPASRRVVWKGTGAVQPLAISDDKTRVLVQRDISATSGGLFLLDYASGQVKPINPSAEEIAYGGGVFAPGGQSILVLDDEGSDFKRLVQIDLATNAKTVLTPPDLKWDVETFDLSPDGRVLAYAVNEGGQSKVVVRDFRTKRALPQPSLPVGVLGALKFSPDSKSLAIGLNTATAPGDVWAWDVAGGRLTRWTTSESGGLDPKALAEPTLTKVRSFDGLEVPAWVYRPGKIKGRAPVIIDIHGGPESQDRPFFNSRRQYWAAELGIVTIAPNVRGSDGYGKAYLKLDNGPKRQDSVRDIGALLDWIAAQPDLDPKRVVVYGGSYGGFMVLACLALYNDRLAGAVDIVGISSFTTFLTNTEGYRRDLRRVEYGDERDPAMKAIFDQISPLNLTDKMTKPLFVIAGKNDPRVPWTEGQQMVEKLRAKGGEAWFMLAADEGHGFRKKQNVDAQREAETMFLSKVFGL